MQPFKDSPLAQCSALRFVSYALAFQPPSGHSTGQPDRGCNRSLSISKNTLPKLRLQSGLGELCPGLSPRLSIDVSRPSPIVSARSRSHQVSRQTAADCRARSVRSDTSDIVTVHSDDVVGAFTHAAFTPFLTCASSRDQGLASPRCAGSRTELTLSCCLTSHVTKPALRIPPQQGKCAGQFGKRCWRATWLYRFGGLPWERH